MGPRTGVRRRAENPVEMANRFLVACRWGGRSCSRQGEIEAANEHSRRMSCALDKCGSAPLAHAHSRFMSDAVLDSRAILMAFLTCANPPQRMVQIRLYEDHEHDRFKRSHPGNRIGLGTRITQWPSQGTKWPRR
jgi:hypothetical protein